jgi:hypothetical protein
LESGGCCTWPLAADATCAAQARAAFAGVVRYLRLPQELSCDGTAMASELAANTLHARGALEPGGAEGWPMAAGPELWIYLRRAGGRFELVCKVFDALPGWKDGRPLWPGPAAPEPVAGHGLQIVAGLSGGRWGHHLTRSRLGGWKVPGKAVWFGQPVPAAAVPAPLHRSRLDPLRAATALEAMLTDRGLGEGLLRGPQRFAGLCVLSVRRGLTVWCHPGAIWWRAGNGRYQRCIPTDLTDAAEQIVTLCEEMAAGDRQGVSRGPLP